jgi:uncharacterized protein
MEKQITGNFMNCPACNIELKMSERSGIEIDYCPKCRGVWLDKGELDKIIERSMADSLPTPNRPKDDDNRYYERDKFNDHNKHYGDDRHYDSRKKKSFLTDLFDF